MDQNLRHRWKPSRGFTVVELLVVIAIIGVMVGLLLSAIQAAREAARRAHCANNLRQLGVGLLLYHDANQEFPPGTWYHSDAYGWGSMILPMIEQQAIFDRIKPNMDKAAERYIRLQNRENIEDVTIPLQPGVTDQVISTFICPSNPMIQIHSPIGTGQGYGGVDVGGHARSDYRGCNGSQGSHISGIFGRLWDDGHKTMRRPTRIKEITDGLSKTFSIGDGCILQHFSRDPVPGASVIWVGANGSSRNVLAKTTYDHLPNSDRSSFASAHPGIVQMSFADGSVRSISEDIDFLTYIFLGDKADGHTDNE